MERGPTLILCCKLSESSKAASSISSCRGGGKEISIDGHRLRGGREGENGDANLGHGVRMNGRRHSHDHCLHCGLAAIVVVCGEVG